MSVFIHSDDYISGNSSEGVWDLGRNLKGQYTVTAQSMDTQDFPWMFAGQNDMVMRIHDPMDILAYTTFIITFDPATGLLSDPTAIKDAMVTAMQTRIDEVAIVNPYAARNVSGNVSTSLGTIVFVFDDDPVDILWTGDPIAEFVSTINPSLGKIGAADELNIGTETISYRRMVTDPKYLFVYIDECANEIITTSASKPTLLFSTKDTEFTGQNIQIRNNTTSLTIKVARMHETTAVPLTGQWYLLLRNTG
jgi:hypothetical protein